jgi:hypothetical protein
MAHASIRLNLLAHRKVKASGSGFELVVERGLVEIALRIWTMNYRNGDVVTQAPFLKMWGVTYEDSDPASLGTTRWVLQSSEPLPEKKRRHSTPWSESSLGKNMPPSSHGMENELMVFRLLSFC